MRRSLLFAVPITLALLSCSSSGGDSRAARDDTAGTAAPADDADHDADWPMGGHDLGSRRSNAAEAALTPGSVRKLAVSWRLDDLKGVSGTPAVVAGTVFVGAFSGEVRALDARTGAKKWTTKVGAEIAGSPAVTADAVYVAAKATTYRLDRATGKIEWSTVVNKDPATDLYGGPIVVDHRVIQPVSASPLAPPQRNYTFRGNVVALAEATGAELWRVYVSDDSARSGAGVSVWQAASADTTRGLTFVGTGNSYAEPTSPLADSIVAIDYHTGKVAWSKQFTSTDVFHIGDSGTSGPDADVGSTPTLWRTGNRDFVGAGDKAGVFHALDRASGTVVWERKLTPGGNAGGVIGGSAFADGHIFVTSNNAGANGLPGHSSTMFALDSATGTTVWKADLEATTYGPASTANGVVYQGTDKPMMHAINATNGKSLFTFAPPSSVGAGASVSNGFVYWGYGYAFGPPTAEAKGGLLAFTVPPGG